MTLGFYPNDILLVANLIRHMSNLPNGNILTLPFGTLLTHKYDHFEHGLLSGNLTRRVHKQQPVRRVVCSVQSVVCDVQCVVCSAWCAVRGVQCSVINVQCVVCRAWCATRGVQCAVSSVQCVVCGV